MIFPPMPESMAQMVVWAFIACVLVDMWIIFKLFSLEKMLAVVVATMPKRKADNGEI